MSKSQRTRAAVRATAGAVAGFVAFGVFGIAEISSRLHQGGVAQLVGPARPSLGSDLTQVATLLLVLVGAGLFVTAVTPVLGHAGAAAFLATILVASLVSWFVFTETTFESFGQSMHLTVDRVAHAASTSVGTFVLAGAVSAGLLSRVMPLRATPSQTDQEPA